MRRSLMIGAMMLASSAAGVSGAEPAPGIGLLVKPNEMPALRKKIKTAPWSEMYARILKEADRGVANWPAQRDMIRPHLSKLLDITVGHCKDWPKEPEARNAGESLRTFAMENMCPAAFVYLMTGDEKYAETTWEILESMGRVNRWGWFTWSGSSMPQIHSAQYFRNAAFAFDFIWDYLSPEQRRKARDILAEKCVEPYFRITLHSPCMGLHHLRSRNQGNNVMSGALIACLALGDDYPDADIWLRSFVQTYHWMIMHDIGWGGQHLDSGLGGYWTVSMQNLYTAASCLAKVKGIDLRGHPGFMESTYYPMYHEATVPPLGTQGFATPFALDYKGPPSVISSRPTELPRQVVRGGAWWYDYAALFPQSPALHFINKAMVQKSDEGELKFFFSNPHQVGHHDIIGLIWSRPENYRPDAPGPSELFKTTDRMTMFRSAYGIGGVYLYMHGDIFLSALNEILVSVVGASWHTPWLGWQKFESGIETENEPMAPSMTVRKSAHDADFSYIHTVSDESDVIYRHPKEQDHCHMNYTRRDRDVLYVRPGPAAPEDPGYFVFLDRVAQREPRWHGQLWQTLNIVHRNNTANYGRYRVETANRARLERPNADLALHVAAPPKVAFEIEAAPGQIAGYVNDHNVATLRILAGGYGRAEGGKVTIPPAAWKGAGQVLQDPASSNGASPEFYRIAGRNALLGEEGTSRNGFEVAADLKANQRYRMAIECRKSEYRIYHNTGWQLDLDLLDAAGRAVAFDRDLENSAKRRQYERPGQYRLEDPRSDTKNTPWIKSDAVYFDVPCDVKVARIRGTLTAASWGHATAVAEHSVLDLGSLTIEPVGSISRKKEEMFLTIATPLAKGAPAPAIETSPGDGEAYAKVPRAGGEVDHIIAAKGKPVSFQGGEALADLALVRTARGNVRNVFAQNATAILLRGVDWLQSPVPVDVTALLGEKQKISQVRIGSAVPVELTLQGETVKLQVGLWKAGADLRFSPDPAGEVLISNSPESMRLLKVGLQPVNRQITAERDELTAQGGRNLALGAKVSASGMRDPRFPPEKVIDNQTWEYPADGRLDYTLGTLKTTPRQGYSELEDVPMSGSEEYPMTTWPFYIRPTYWLLPYEKAGWIHLELAQETPVKTVRLLNTSNAGANDYATMRYRIELLDGAGKVVAERKGEFGKVFDRPFKQAFMIPEFFAKYGPTFKGMLEPGIKVPFGDGWQTVSFPGAPKTKAVKVYVDSYWALGGGLNEIQVY